MYPGAPVSPSIFIEEAPEVRAAYVDWDSPAVMEDIYGKPKCMFSFLHSIWHLLTTNHIDIQTISGITQEAASTHHTSSREEAPTHHTAIYIPLRVQSLPTRHRRARGASGQVCSETRAA